MKNKKNPAGQIRTSRKSSKPTYNSECSSWCAYVKYIHPERPGFDVIIRDDLDFLIEDLMDTINLQFSTQIGPVPNIKVIKIYNEDLEHESYKYDSIVHKINEKSEVK